MFWLIIVSHKSRFSTGTVFIWRHRWDNKATPSKLWRHDDNCRNLNTLSCLEEDISLTRVVKIVFPLCRLAIPITRKLNSVAASKKGIAGLTHQSYNIKIRNAFRQPNELWWHFFFLVTKGPVEFSNKKKKKQKQTIYCLSAGDIVT